VSVFLLSYKRVVISFDLFAQESYRGRYGILLTLSTECRVVKHSRVHTYFWSSVCFRVQDSNYRQYGLNITYMQSVGLSIQDDAGGKINILEGHCEKKVHMNII
jgi:hypothetical protein